MQLDLEVGVAAAEIASAEAVVPLAHQLLGQGGFSFLQSGGCGDHLEGGAGEVMLPGDPVQQGVQRVGEQPPGVLGVQPAGEQVRVVCRLGCAGQEAAGVHLQHDRSARAVAAHRALHQPLHLDVDGEHHVMSRPRLPPAVFAQQLLNFRPPLALPPGVHHDAFTPRHPAQLVLKHALHPGAAHHVPGSIVGVFLLL